MTIDGNNERVGVQYIDSQRLPEYVWRPIGGSEWLAVMGFPPFLIHKFPFDLLPSDSSFFRAHPLLVPAGFSSSRLSLRLHGESLETQKDATRCVP